MTLDLRYGHGLRRASGGFLLALVVSTGLVVERAAPGNALAAAGSIAMALAVALVLYGTTAHEPTDRASTHGLLAVAQAVGALIGVVLVHAVLQRAFLERLTWLREDPRQLVNDFVAVFGILGVIWGCARRPPAIWPIAFGIALVAIYAVTSSRWHFDVLPHTLAFRAVRPMSVQSFVVVQVAGISACVALFRARAAASIPARSTPSTASPVPQTENARMDGILLLTVILVLIAVVVYR